MGIRLASRLGWAGLVLTDIIELLARLAEDILSRIGELHVKWRITKAIFVFVSSFCPKR